VATAPPVVEKVTRTRTLTAAEAAQDKPDRTTPEFWQFIEKMTPEMWGNDFTLYILREDPKPSLYGGTNTLEKCPGYISMPDGTKQPLSSREDIELAIKQKYGGKAFRLILKRTNGERICEGKCINEAQPRYPDANPQSFQGPLPNASAQGSSDGVAIKAMDTIANQNPQLINIAIDAVSRAAEIVSRHAATPPAAPPAQDNDLDRAFKQAMITKLLAPPPDPFEMFVKFKQLMSDGGGSSSPNAMVDKVLTAAIDRFMNPVTAVTGRTTLLDVGREVLPALINGGKEIMHEYRLSLEAQAHIAETQRGLPMQPQPVQQIPIVQPAPVAQPNPQPPPPAAAPSMTFPQIAGYIANVVKNAQHSTDEAVEDVLAFLYNTSPDGTLVRLLLDPPKLDRNLKPGKDGLLQLFQFEPSLNTCLTNLPRVSDFLDKFIIAATEAERQEALLRAAAPGNTPPAAQPV
jgi:hypothetical protein